MISYYNIIIISSCHSIILEWYKNMTKSYYYTIITSQWVSLVWLGGHFWCFFNLFFSLQIWPGIYPDLFLWSLGVSWTHVFFKVCLPNFPTTKKCWIAYWIAIWRVPHSLDGQDVFELPRVLGRTGLVLAWGPRVLGRTSLVLAWGAKGPGPGRLGS